MSHSRVRASTAISCALALLWVGNHSSCGTLPRATPKLLAHRGVHQTFPLERIDWEACTACVIRPPTHAFLENTLESMRAAFELGADRVELDLQLTSDDAFAVFHDYTLDCRTNAHGVVRDHTLAELQKLDIGWGYSADGGATHPFRGRGIGLMPSLDDVLASFPRGRFLLHLKSREPIEAMRLAERLARLPPAELDRLIVYGSDASMTSLKAALPALRVTSGRSLRECGVRYILLGWSGYVPQACRQTLLLVPNTYAWLLWGWPLRFQRRVEAYASEVAVVNRVNGMTGGIDNVEELERLAPDFSASIWTNRVELLAPALER